MAAQPDFYMWVPNDLSGFYHLLNGCPSGTGLSLSEEERSRVSSLFDQVSAVLKPKVVVVLTGQPSDPTATEVYVLLEPCAQVVIALSSKARRGSQR
jgi:hypothetical protein